MPLHGRVGSDGVIFMACRLGNFLSISLAVILSGCATVDEQPSPIPVDRVPSTIPSPSAAEAFVAPGYRAEIVVSLLNYPSSLTFDPVGNLYVAESGAAPGDESRPPRILRIAPGGQIDIMSDKVQTPVKDLEWRDGLLLVWHGNKVCSVDHEGQLRDLSSTTLPSSKNNELVITDLTAAFGRPGQVLKILTPTRDHGGQVVRANPKSRRGDVFFCARTGEKGPAVLAGPGPRRPVDLQFSSDGQALYIVDFGATLMTRDGFHSFPETGVIWRIVHDGTKVTNPPPNLAPPPQIERRPITQLFRVGPLD